MKTLKINDVLISKDKNNKLTYNIPSYMTGELFAKFKQKNQLLISEFKNK